MRGVIEKIDGGLATIHCDDGQVLQWQTRQLPIGSRVTSVVDITVTVVNVPAHDHAAVSRKALNSILQSHPAA